jgi:hypothetical protein
MNSLIYVFKSLVVSLPIAFALYWLMTLAARRLLLKPAQLKVASVVAATAFVLIAVLYPPINNLSPFIIAVKWPFLAVAIYCWRRSIKISAQSEPQQ